MAFQRTITASILTFAKGTNKDIKETTKLFIRNDGLDWRILEYVLVCLLIICGLSVAICYPLIQNLSEAGFFTQIAGLITDNFANLRLDQMFDGIAQLLVSFAEIVSQNLATILPFAIVLIVIIEFFGSFLLGLGELAIHDSIYHYMGSNIKLSFSSCFIKNLRKSVKLQLAKLVVIVPINLVIIAAFICTVLLFTLNNFWLSFFAPFLCVLVVVFLNAIKSTIFCAWAPCMVVRNQGVWASLKESVLDVCKNFGKIFGRQLVMSVVFIAVNIAAIILTASVGLFLTIPATILFNSILGMVIYFYINGLKFYVDSDEIISPKKKEDWEPVENLKYIV